MGLHLLLSRLHNGSDKCARRYFSKISTSSWSSTNHVYPPFPEKDPRVVGSCNGLLCLEYRDREEEMYVLWNPATDTFQKIPPSNLKYRPCVVCNSTDDNDDDDETRGRCRRSTSYQTLRALAFDAESQDYKFVRFLTNYYEYETEDDFYDHGDSIQVEVYSLRNNSWKEVPLGRDVPSFCDSNVVYLNGFCYLKHGAVIASFDLLNHKYSAFPCPDIIVAKKEEYSFQVFLLELQGSLGVVIYPRKGITKLFSFWIYAASSSSSSSSWTRVMSLDVRLVGADQPLWFGKNDRNGESLLLQGVDGALLEYDYTEKKLKKIDQIYGFKGRMRIYPYVETNHML